MPPRSQYSSATHASPPRPQGLPRQRSSWVTFTPAVLATHSLQYSRPSQPHTPGQSSSQPSGRGTHAPGIREGPHSPGAKWQNWSGAHSSFRTHSAGQKMGGHPPGSQLISPKQSGQQISPGAQTRGPHTSPVQKPSAASVTPARFASHSLQ